MKNICHIISDLYPKLALAQLFVDLPALRTKPFHYKIYFRYVVTSGKGEGGDVNIFDAECLVTHCTGKMNVGDMLMAMCTLAAAEEF